MKNIFTLTVAILIAGIQSIHGQPPATFILQPSAGLNDGSDQGGPNSGKDAWVYEGDPSVNYGDSPVLYALPISNCNNTHVVGFIQFDVSSLPSNVDSVVFGVKHLPHTTYCYSNCNADFYFARVLQSWDEMTVNYSNQPTWDTAFYGPINVAFPNDFGAREYNITSTYLLWKNGTVPNNGFAVYSSTIGCNNAAVYFETLSSDDTASATRPYLKVYYGGSGIHSSVAEKINFTLSPNPAQDFATMKFTLNENETAVFRLTDVTGRQVAEEKIIQGTGHLEIPLDLSGMNKGLYFYTLETNEGTVSGKLIH